jgi:ribokinase
MCNVVVLGSANADLVVHVERRPEAGETLLGSDVQLFPGGKGANQAAAAARSGAHVTFLGALGRDGNADFLRRSLADAGVDTSHVVTVNRPTGSALVLLTPDGDNSIVVSPGANTTVDVAAAEAVSEYWLAADVLVLNLETPLATAVHVVERAHAAGVRVLLNAAPAQVLDAATIARCDPLVVNEHEARVVLDEPSTEHATFSELAAKLLAAGAPSVVITLGARGALIAEASGITEVPAYRVTATDTTGAGDAFVGAVATELARGESLVEAARFATAMSAVAVQRMGAQSSYAPRAEVEEFIAAQG